MCPGGRGWRPLLLGIGRGFDETLLDHLGDESPLLSLNGFSNDV